MRTHCPLNAGFPLTDAQLSSSYTVLSAHAPDKVDWSAYAKLDTLVILMAGKTMCSVMDHLRDSGWAVETPVSGTGLMAHWNLSLWPMCAVEVALMLVWLVQCQGVRCMQVAVIRHAGTQQQTVWKATIGTVCDKLSGIELSPSVIVVGQIVELQSYAT